MPVTHMRRGIVLEIGNDEDDAECLGAMCAEPWCERDAAAAALRLVELRQRFCGACAR
jgi:hypothetical protein